MCPCPNNGTRKKAPAGGVAAGATDESIYDSFFKLILLTKSLSNASWD
jgi:hypothetical protein